MRIFNRWSRLFLAVLTLATIAPQIASVRPALADDGGYPWIGATPLNSSTSDYGYSTCPSNDSNCMSHTYVKNGVTYGEYDPWSYNLRNCTSYAAWKASQQFHADVHGWGNAATWDTGATHTNAGYAVYPGSSHTPVVGELAQWGTEKDGGLGHVAYVASVDPSTHYATLWEYNVGLDGNFYYTRTTGPGASNAGTPDHYIHLGSVVTRMMYVNTTASAFSNDSLNNTWTTQVNDDAITGISVGASGRMMTLDNSGTVRAKDGVSDTWTLLWNTNAAKAVSVGGGGRMALIDANNHVWAKNAINDTFIDLWGSNAAQAIAVGGNASSQSYGRMLMIDGNSDVWAKDGLNDSWSEIWSSNSAQAIAVGANGRMMLIDANSNIWAKDGMTDVWTQETTGNNVSAIACGGNGRQFLIATNGDAYAQDALSGSWGSVQMHNTSKIAVGDDGRLVAIDNSGQAWGKIHLNDSWTALTGTNTAALIAAQND